VCDNNFINMKKEKNKKLYKGFFINIFRNNKKEFVTIIAIAAFGSLLIVFTPYLYGRIFDLALIPKTETIFLLSLIGIWAFLSLISNFISARTSEIGEILGAKIALKTEVESYGHFLTLPISFHKSKKTGEILEKISRGSWSFEHFIQMVANILPSILFLLFALIIMLIIQWQLGVIAIFTVIIYSIITLRLIKPLIKSQTKLHHVFEKEYGSVYDKLYNVFLIKNFTLEKVGKKEFYKSFIEKAFSMSKDSAKKAATLQHVQGIVYNLSFVAMLGTAIFLLRDNEITQGQFIMFFGYISLFFKPFSMLGRIYSYYKRASVAIERIIKLKEIVPESVKHGNKTIEKFKGKIEFKQVSFSYSGKKEILSNVNLKINSGESIALVGGSGVGKTIFTELILGYYKPSNGTIFLDGIDIQKLKLQWLRKQIAVVSQEISLFNDTLIKNLRYANPKASFKNIVEAATAANAHTFIMSLPQKYKTFIGERGVRLSVGQKQRIAITMAFLRDPKILILDEPTSALDAKSEQKVQEGIKRLISNRTTIIIAHRLSITRDVDKIVVLHNGEIVEVGNHKELMEKQGKYYELHLLQRGLD